MCDKLISKQNTSENHYYISWKRKLKKEKENLDILFCMKLKFGSISKILSTPFCILIFTHKLLKEFAIYVELISNQNVERRVQKTVVETHYDLGVIRNIS